MTAPEATKRQAAIMLRVTHEQKERWLNAAYARGLSIAELIRRAVETDLAVYPMRTGNDT